MFCVSSSCFSSASLVAMRWVRLCPRCFHCGAHDWFALSFLHVLRSYASYTWPINPLAFVQNTIYIRNLSMYSLLQKPSFTHCFGLNSSPGLRKHMLCVKAHLPTKQNADSQKKRVFSVSQHHVSCVCFAFPRVLSFTLLVG